MQSNEIVPILERVDFGNKLDLPHLAKKKKKITPVKMTLPNDSFPFNRFP